MTNRMTLHDCVLLATFAHRNQYDKAGEPYINHPLRVLESVKAVGAQAYVQMAAVLHDVTEDTPFTPEMLVALGVPEAAVRIVELLDRDISKNHFMDWGQVFEGTLKPKPLGLSGTPDEYYYRRIRQNPGALIVKKADIGDNTQPWRLEYLPPETQERLRAKYAKALDQLSNG